MLKKLYALGFSLFKKYEELIVYVFFGGLTTVVNYVVFVLFNLFVFKRSNVEISVTIAWIFAVLFAYVTNKKYVFKSKTQQKSHLLKEAASFFAFRGASLLFDVGFMWLFVTVFSQNEYIFKILSNVIIVFLNYFASKLFIFKKK